MAVSAFCSWSGGKDSCLALDRFMAENPGSDIRLLTMLNNDGVTGAHGLSSGLLERQANAMGLRITFGTSGRDDYEEMWGLELEKLRESGVSAGIFGDIDLEEHRVWIRRVLEIHGLETLLPLWNCDRESIVSECIGKGYLARILSVNASKMDESFLGRDLTPETVEELKRAGIDPSGEGGEFHTFVYDGPLFGTRVDFEVGGVFSDDRYVFLGLR